MQNTNANAGAVITVTASTTTVNAIVNSSATSTAELTPNTSNLEYLTFYSYLLLTYTDVQAITPDLPYPQVLPAAIAIVSGHPNL